MRTGMNCRRMQGGATAGMAAVNVAVGGVKAYRSAVERMAANSGEQAAVYLSEYFGKQGWIPPDRVKKAKQ
jgi:spore maturation protein SpmB